MQITAGKYRSLRLKTLPTTQTRPTSSLVKEAIFSSIGPYFTGGVMLDLFAGSGAMGLEAISRGFEFCYFADRNPAAVKIIRSNISTLAVQKQTLVWQLDFIAVLKKCVALNLKFDLIYLDPPYLQYDVNQLLASINAFDLLNEHGQIICETQKDQALLANYGIITRSKEKIFSLTKITFYQKGTE